MAPGWRDVVSLAVFRSFGEWNLRQRMKIAFSSRSASLHSTSFRGSSKSRTRNLEIPGSMLCIAPE
jgi:hypothetical protein